MLHVAHAHAHAHTLAWQSLGRRVLNAPADADHPSADSPTVLIVRYEYTLVLYTKVRYESGLVSSGLFLLYVNG